MKLCDWLLTSSAHWTYIFSVKVYVVKVVFPTTPHFQRWVAMRMTGTTWTVTHITARDRSPNACGRPSSITSSEPWSLTLPSTTTLMPRTSNSLPRRLVSQSGYYRYDIICNVLSIQCNLQSIQCLHNTWPISMYFVLLSLNLNSTSLRGILLVAVEDFLYKKGTFYYVGFECFTIWDLLKFPFLVPFILHSWFWKHTAYYAEWVFVVTSMSEETHRIWYEDLPVTTMLLSFFRKTDHAQFS